MSASRSSSRVSTASRSGAASPTNLVPKDVSKDVAGDQIGFTVGVINMILTVFVAARWPWHFWILHLVKTFVYIPWRYKRFGKMKARWYLVDFCYVVGCYFATIFCATAYLSSDWGFSFGGYYQIYKTRMFRTLFALSTGPLAFSVVIFRNSIVFHNVDQLASVFIHLSPALLCWTIRWGGGFSFAAVEEHWPGMFAPCPDSYPDASCTDWGAFSTNIWDSPLWCGTCTPTIDDFSLYPVCAWLFWAILYYLLVFVIFADKISKSGSDTLYNYTVQTGEKGKKPSIHLKFMKLFPGKMRKIAYLLGHLITCLVFSACGWLFWQSFLLHTVFLCGVVFVAAYNGAGYFFKKVLSPADKLRQDEGLGRAMSYGSLL